jgi:prepilin-type N-terminal cleavage/methylation domain-containing protein
MAAMFARLHAGITLLELLCSLAIMGLLLGMVAVPVARAGDVLATRAARAAILNAAATTPAHWHLPTAARRSPSAPDGIIAWPPRQLGADTLASREPAGWKSHSTMPVWPFIRFDALGLGRLAAPSGCGEARTPGHLPRTGGRPASRADSRWSK